MPNKHKGEVSLVIDELEYTLRLTFSKVAELEAMGINLFDAESLSGIGVQLKLFYVLTKGQHGVETEQDADELLMQDYTACSSASSEALTLFFQVLTAKEEKKANQ